MIKQAQNEQVATTPSFPNLIKSMFCHEAKNRQFMSTTNWSTRKKGLSQDLLVPLCSSSSASQGTVLITSWKNVDDEEGDRKSTGEKMDYAYM